MILLTGKSEEFIIDEEDYDKVSKFKWRLDVKGYVVATIYKDKDYKNPITLKLSRYLMGLELNDPRQVDHIDGNVMNNSKSNLRICSLTENAQNKRLYSNSTSGYKGVSFHKGKWCARIQFNGKRIHIGYYDTPKQAALAYDESAINHHKQFAVLNFPQEVLV